MEDMTAYVTPDLPDEERKRLDRLFPAAWSTPKPGGPDIVHAFTKVSEHFADFIEPGYGPKLIRDWEKTWDSERPYIAWAIVWEEGPDDWAITFSHAEVVDRTRVFVEPGNGWALSLNAP